MYFLIYRFKGVIPKSTIAAGTTEGTWNNISFKILLHKPKWKLKGQRKLFQEYGTHSLRPRRTADSVGHCRVQQPQPTHHRHRNCHLWARCRGMPRSWVPASVPHLLQRCELSVWVSLDWCWYNCFALCGWREVGSAQSSWWCLTLPLGITWRRVRERSTGCLPSPLSLKDRGTPDLKIKPNTQALKTRKQEASEGSICCFHSETTPWDTYKHANTHVYTSLPPVHRPLISLLPVLPGGCFYLSLTKLFLPNYRNVYGIILNQRERKCLWEHTIWLLQTLKPGSSDLLFFFFRELQQG